MSGNWRNHGEGAEVCKCRSHSEKSCYGLLKSPIKALQPIKNGGLEFLILDTHTCLPVEMVRNFVPALLTPISTYLSERGDFRVLVSV
jgi:hypothetical protein